VQSSNVTKQTKKTKMLRCGCANQGSKVETTKHTGVKKTFPNSSDHEKSSDQDTGKTKQNA
jgi:hypothetical protein